MQQDPGNGAAAAVNQEGAANTAETTQTTQEGTQAPATEGAGELVD